MREASVAGRRFLVDGDAVRAVWPEPDAGLRLVVDGREITAADLRLARADATPGGGLAWRLTGEGVTADFTVEPDGSVARTRLALSGTGRLAHVEVERWARSTGLRGPNAVAGLRGPNAVAGLRGPNAVAGLGQPVLGDGWFAALEHPGAEDLGLAVDVDLAAGPFVMPPLAVGSAPPGDELSSLWDEVDRVRARPARFVLLANNWYQLGFVGRMDQASVAAELEGFDGVTARHDLPLDWYCLDDPWDGGWTPETGIWGRLDPARFPAGLPAPGRTGLWVSPWGGYFDRHDARVAWGAEHGYEVSDGRRGPNAVDAGWPCLCPAGDRYRAHLAESMARFTAAGVGYWKIDGVQFDCPAPDHGHGGRTDQMDRFAGLLDGLRAVRPDAILTFTTGSNPSPWWLRHADFIWRGGLDDDAPADYHGGRHERFATYIDACLDALRPSSVPVSAIVTFSVVENGARTYREEGDGLDAWERHCWLLAARGTLHHDLYVAPDSLSEAEWAVLARALRWARNHQHVLARSRMVGGRPQAGEAYGFASTAPGGEVILCLRNPSGRSQPAPAVVLDDAEPVYGRWREELAPFEVVVVSGRRRADRASQISRSSSTSVRVSPPPSSGTTGSASASDGSSSSTPPP